MGGDFVRKKGCFFCQERRNGHVFFYQDRTGGEGMDEENGVYHGKWRLERAQRRCREVAELLLEAEAGGECESGRMATLISGLETAADEHIQNAIEGKP